MLLLLGLVLLAWWNSPWLWPLKIVVVLFHELGHAAAAWASGGSVEAIALSPQQGGATLTRGGNALLVLNAGYLGSLLAGALLLAGSRDPRSAARLATALAIFLPLVALLLVRPLFGFGFLFTLLAGVAFAALARFGSGAVSGTVLSALGLFSVLYALWDIRDDVFGGKGGVTDASMLAEITWIPAPIWGGLWLVAGIALVIVFRRRLL